MLQRRIGEGTFAEVWRAADLNPGPAGGIVALKIFRPLAKDADDGAWEPVYREVAAGLRMPAHPNVVRSWAVLHTDYFGGRPTPCLVMDFVEGANLALWLADQPPPGPGSIAPRLAVLTGLMQGIAHAHAHGVVHQDISFGNVLVRGSDPPDALLTDFGCAQAGELAPGGETEDDDAAELQPIHPPPYTLRQPLADSTRRDVYGFGTLCYLALVGRHPLSDNWQTMRTGLWEGPKSPHGTLARRDLIELGPWLRGMPGMAALSDLLLRCVAADPARRPAAEAVRAEWMAIIGATSRC